MPAPIVTHRDPSIVQLFNLFADYINQLSGGGGVPVVTTNVIRVDVNGSNATGQRNRFDLPFQTIQAAVNAAQDKDLILVGPGTFAEQVTVPPTIGVSILGAGIQETVLDFAVQALIWNPTVDTNFIVSGISFPTGGIVVSPSFNSLGITGLIAFDNLLLAPAPANGIELTRVNVALVTNCIGNALGNSSVVIRNSANVQVRGGLNFSVSSVYDPLNPVPSLGARNVNVNGCNLVNVVLAQLAEMEIDQSTVRLGVLAILTDNPTGDNGSLRASDSELGDVSITATFLTVGTPVNAGDIKRCGMKDLVTDAAASTISRVRVRARNCVIDPVNPINAGDKIDLDLRGSQFPQASLAFMGSGRINRSMYRMQGVAVPAVPGTPPIVIPIPYSDPDYFVSFELAAFNSAAHVIPGPTKTFSQFNAGGTFGGVPSAVGADIMILQN